MTYISPEVISQKFTCPSCSTVAHQTWGRSTWDLNSRFTDDNRNPIRVSSCAHCNDHTLWVYDKMVYPDTGSAPPPNEDMPDLVKNTYLEAASIHSKSPRGSAALLRLAIQQLCIHLGEKGHKIDEDIGSLVKKGLPPMIQQSLDIVRVVGNNAVHPGQIDTNDPEAAKRLFPLVNIIVEYMITMPKRVSALYTELPQGALQGINRRDSKKG